jgi:hypothetical protein
MKKRTAICLLTGLLFSFAPGHRFRNRNYYFSESGNDQNEGSLVHPLRSIAKFNRLVLHPGDSVFFRAGDSFSGSLILDSKKSGQKDFPVVIGSYRRGWALIDAGKGIGLTIDNCSYIEISGLHLRGSGRKTGNKRDGVLLKVTNHVTVSNLDISGLQKSGLFIYASRNMTCIDIYAHDNGSAGITVDGDDQNKKSSRDIDIIHCRAVNNPGDPTELDNHSGNGIIVGHCTNVHIDHCMASENGWDMPRTGNGPVGIWAYEADSILIEHCLSFLNKTSKGAADGGGFDLDGGVTHSVIQYCFSYGNQGAGYCLFQYAGASPWHDNIYRFNISENDGLVSEGRAGVFIWNGSGDELQFYNCDFYNNSIYNAHEADLSFSVMSKNRRFRFFNNIFVAWDSLIRGDKGRDLFIGNDWHSLQKGFSSEGVFNFRDWMNKSGQESENGVVQGSNLDPHFQDPGKAQIRNADSLIWMKAYLLPDSSFLKRSGSDLYKTYGIERGKEDFMGKPLPVKGVGACL